MKLIVQKTTKCGRTHRLVCLIHSFLAFMSMNEQGNVVLYSFQTSFISVSCKSRTRHCPVTRSYRSWCAVSNDVVNCQRKNFDNWRCTLKLILVYIWMMAKMVYCCPQGLFQNWPTISFYTSFYSESMAGELSIGGKLCVCERTHLGVS